MDDRADGHAREWHGVARLHVDFRTGHNSVANAKALRCDDVVLFAIIVFDEGDERRPVRVIFNPLNRCRLVEFASFEINDAIEPLHPAALATHGDPSGVVPAALFRQTLREGLDGTTFIQLRTVDQNQPALARRRRLVRF